MIWVGGVLLPHFNFFANLISGILNTDLAVNTAIDVYPGDLICRYQQAHSIWHEESANGLLELVILADYIGYIIYKNQ